MEAYFNKKGHTIAGDKVGYVLGGRTHRHSADRLVGLTQTELNERLEPENTGAMLMHLTDLKATKQGKDNLRKYYVRFGERLRMFRAAGGREQGQALDEASQPKTQFWWNGELWFWKRMTYGYVNASATFQTVMDTELAKAGLLDNATCYVDGVCVFSACL